MQVKFYCSECQDQSPVFIEPMQSDDLNGNAVFGDVVCSVCTLVIATITVEESGIYEFVRVSELEDAS